MTDERSDFNDDHDESLDGDEGLRAQLKKCFTSQGFVIPHNLSTLQHQCMLQEMPESIKKRLRALKCLQVMTTKLEADFYAEVHALEFKYHQLYYPFFEKRCEIINGTYEPTEEESKWELEDPSVKAYEKLKGLSLTEETKEMVTTQFPEGSTGIPNFWLTVFRNVSLLSEMVQEHDEPVISKLLDIKIIYLEKDPMGFVLEFHFAPNEYFSNSVLTKEYSLKCEPLEDDPFSFEGPEIYKCIGCKIDWYKGKNLTMRIIRKRQKHKFRESERTIVKQVPNDSFFNFFSPPTPSEEDGDFDEETQQLLSSDYEIGHYLRDRIIPRAVLYFTGEGLDEEEQEEEEDLEEEDDDEDEEEEDGEEDKEESFRVKNSKKKPIAAAAANNPDCKQQ